MSDALSSPGAFAPSLRVGEVQRYSLRPSTRPGPDIVSLASGEPDADTPLHIRQALIDAVHAGATHYAAWDGDPQLRDAVASHATLAGHRQLVSDNVLITHGGSAALAAAILATVNPGDRVAIPTPTYSLYADLVRLAGGDPVFVRQQPDFQLDLDALAASSMSARLIVLCNPCNPTGAVYDWETLEAVGAIAERHGALVLVDEAYGEIVYDAAVFVSALDVPRLQDRLIYAQTFSKTYAMTGWRVGYLVADPEVIRAAALVHRSMAGPLNTAVQRAALVALTGDQSAVATMLGEYRRRRQLVIETLGDARGLHVRAPAGTFYAFVEHDRRTTSMEFAARARAAGVAIRAGAEFGPGGEGFIRLSFATRDDLLKRGLSLLRTVLPEPSPVAV